MNDKNIKELLTRTVSEVIDKKHLEQELSSGRKLKIKLGIDPTSPDLHIGRAVVLWKLRQFQELGHKVVLITGDFTGLIGDTSDKDSERPMLTEEQVKKNMKDYVKQAGKILDLKKVDFVYNSKWLAKLNYLEIGRQADQFGLNEFIQRENIRRRMAAGKRVSLREVLYPLMQGYDSVAVEADVEIGGTDQRFNLLAGRALQPLYKQKPQDILMVNLLEGTDGRKMSSSWGNVINITDEPNDMFGKTMAINDGLIVKYFEYATQVPMEEVKNYEKQLKAGANPRDIKKKLAYEIVALYYDKKKAGAAEKEWSSVFSKKEKPSVIPIGEISEDQINGDTLPLDKTMFLSGATSSTSAARRLIEQGAVEVDDKRTKNAKEVVFVKEGPTIKYGRKYLKVKIKFKR